MYGIDLNVYTHQDAHALDRPCKHPLHLATFGTTDAYDSDNDLDYNSDDSADEGHE